MAQSQPCELPLSSRLRTSLPRIDYLDSYSVPSTADGRHLVALYAATLGHLPAAFKHLLAVRSALVRPFGIAGVSYADLTQPIDPERIYDVGNKLGRWTLFDKQPDELITGANDKHLDFRVSFLREREERIVLSTAVMTHNMFGRAYLRTILPFHRFGVARLLSNASNAGRI